MEAARDLGPNLRGGELNYVCDKATLEELKVALEVVRDQRLTKLSYTTKITPALVEKDVNSFWKAKQAGRRALFSIYVLERTCLVIGERVQKSLRELDLEGMPVGPWVKALSLNTSSTLTKVSLRHCRIGNEGCKALRTIGLSTALKEIDLTGNAISDDGAEEIARLLCSQSFRRVIDPEFMGLQKVVLNYNDIGDRGLARLVDMMLNDFWIKSLELRSCRVASPGDSVRLARVNKVVQIFDLRDNPIDLAVVHEINRILIARHPHGASEYKWRDKDNLFANAADTVAEVVVGS